LQLGHNYIGTEHILLGLIREGEGVAAQVLVKLGADLGRVRQQVIQLLSGYQGPGGKSEGEPVGAKDTPQEKGGSQILDQFGRNLTQLARDKKLDPVIVRHKEMERVMQILSRRTKNNPVLIGDRDAVVRFVFVAQALQDLDGVSNFWFFNFDRLKATLKCCIFFEVLTKLVECCCTDCLQFATREHWLKNRRCVDCAFCCTCTDKRVDLVDEQNDVATSFDFFEHFLQTLFKVSAIATACNKCTEVECVELFACESLGHVVAHDLLSKTFNDCSFTNTWLADENRIVFGTA